VRARSAFFLHPCTHRFLSMFTRTLARCARSHYESLHSDPRSLRSRVYSPRSIARSFIPLAQRLRASLTQACRRSSIRCVFRACLPPQQVAVSWLALGFPARLRLAASRGCRKVSGASRRAGALVLLGLLRQVAAGPGLYIYNRCECV